MWPNCLENKGATTSHSLMNLHDLLQDLIYFALLLHATTNERLQTRTMTEAMKNQSKLVPLNALNLTVTEEERIKCGRRRLMVL
jgi:hypothetical protein